MNQKRIYNTKQKDKIIGSISSFGDKHFTAAELISKINSEGISVGQATIYRMIDRMVNKGELRKYIVDGTTAACYQLAEKSHEKKCSEHFHLKCESCSRLIHVECEELLKISSHMNEEHGFIIDSSKTVFYGLCKECKIKEKIV